MEFHTHTLANNMRVVFLPTTSPVSHFGVFIQAGSRDEQAQEQGMAHFIEHCLFKGTTKRKAYQVLSRLEHVGGEINAFTAKEDTCIYASFTQDHLKRTVELFYDILYQSSFPKKELEKEKAVIVDEIKSYKDSPYDDIFDVFEDIVFKNHPLGRNILGTKQTLSTFTQEKVRQFMAAYYNTEDIVICLTGNYSPKQAINTISTYFEQVPSSARKTPRLPFNGYTPETKVVPKTNYQSHCLLGTVTYDANHEKKSGLLLLNNILGGPGLNSRLNMNIREKYGFCYTIESNYTALSDTGLFSIYLGTENNALEKSIDLIYRELNLLKSTPLGTLQLHRAKQQMIGQFIISNESNLSKMLAIGKSYLMFNKIDTVEEVCKKIDSLSGALLQEIANEVFDLTQFSILTYKTKK